MQYNPYLYSTKGITKAHEVEANLPMLQNGQWNRIQLEPRCVITPPLRQYFDSVLCGHIPTLAHICGRQQKKMQELYMHMRNKSSQNTNILSQKIKTASIQCQVNVDVWRIFIELYST